MATGIFQTTFPGAVELQRKVHEANYIIGLDLHKKTTAMTVIDRCSGKVVFNHPRIQNDQVLKRITMEYPGKKIIVSEAAFGWRLMRDAALSLPDTTFIPLDARKTSAWVQMSGIKTDKVDAQVLAYACLHDGVQRLAVYQPSGEDNERYKLFIHRHGLVRQRAAIKNKIKALTRDYGVNPYTGEEQKHSDIITHLQNDLLDEMIFLAKKITALEKEMAQIGKQDTTYGLLLSIPGIGPITAFALRYKMGTIERFASAKHLASYFGFGIRQKQSGASSRSGSITCHGDEHIRSLLVQGAQVVLFRYKHFFPLFFPHMDVEHMNKNKLVIAFARKMLTFSYHCWKHGEKFDLSRYAEMRKKQPTGCQENTDPVMIPYAADPVRTACPM